jgi:diaminohydroxyphosphoribosylaminopyrimidine deaminase/5-amino-6-(5-phosphoribosylamino)uracil reductase
MKHNLVDEKYMRMAISLARKGIGRTSPNPNVGAVLVKDGKIVASAYHKKAGSIHAEALAIKKAGKKAHGATLYVTLEACTHYGKTPPCVDAIIGSGIKRAVFGMRDPNPVNYGRGIASLKQAGVKTKCGVLSKESSKLNKPFVKFMKRGLPYVTIKMAQSVDGKIADTQGNSKWITSELSRRFVHKMRAQHDAIMVGVNTLFKDNPLLTHRFRAYKNKKQPLGIVIDTNLRTPLQSRILKDIKTGKRQVLIVGGKRAPLAKKEALEKKGAKTVLLPRKNGRVNLVYLMKYLASMNAMSILCEGGSELAASLLREKLADEAFFFISPSIIGGRTSKTSCGGLYGNIKKKFRLKNVGVERIGPDILVKGSL